MLNLIIRALLLVSMFAPGWAGEKVTLYGDDDYAPYSYVENGQFKGIYVEMLKQVVSRLAPDYEVELKPIPWKRGMRDLELGTALGVFPPYLRRELRPYIQPYSVPLYREVVVLFCNETVMKTPRKKFPEDFYGLTIGVNLGFFLSEPLLVAAKQGKLVLEEAKGNDANILKLAGKRIDCYVNDRLSVWYTAKQLRATPTASANIRNLKLHEAAELSEEKAYVGYSETFKAPYKDDFINRMNSAIEEVRKTGLVDRLIAQHAM